MAHIWRPQRSCQVKDLGISAEAAAQMLQILEVWRFHKWEVMVSLCWRQRHKGPTTGDLMVGGLEAGSWIWKAPSWYQAPVVSDAPHCKREPHPPSSTDGPRLRLRPPPQARVLEPAPAAAATGRTRQVAAQLPQVPAQLVELDLRCQEDVLRFGKRERALVCASVLVESNQNVSQTFTKSSAQSDWDLILIQVSVCMCVCRVPGPRCAGSTTPRSPPG